jgi:hypothetical protein
MRFFALRPATERIIDEALSNQPERADKLGFLSLAEIHAIEMMEVFFNVEGHQPRASFPAESGQPPAGAYRPLLWKKYAPSPSPIRGEDGKCSR